MCMIFVKIKKRRVNLCLALPDYHTWINVFLILWLLVSIYLTILTIPYLNNTSSTYDPVRWLTNELKIKYVVVFIIYYHNNEYPRWKEVYIFSLYFQKSAVFCYHMDNIYKSSVNPWGIIWRNSSRTGWSTKLKIFIMHHRFLIHSILRLLYIWIIMHIS